MADGIDGQPGVMSATQVAGPTGAGGYLVNAGEDLQPAMEEGKAFVRKDGPASDRLVQFVKDVSIGFDAYTNRAQLAGHDYLDSDQRGADGLRTVEKIDRHYI